MSVEVLPVEGLPEVRPGDDLATLLAGPLGSMGVRDGDVVAVTQKIVSKAEGRVVPEGEGGREAWVERETRRLVARRGDLVIAETRHGFVCANAGVDASNVEEGFLTLLPEDPDGSAERLRRELTRTARRRARRRHHGHVRQDLAARGRERRDRLCRPPGARRPPRDRRPPRARARGDGRGARGRGGGRERARDGQGVAGAGRDRAGRGRSRRRRSRCAETVRPPEEDLFRTSPLLSISERRTIRAFGDGEVSREAVEEAVRAACTAPAPHHTRPWSFSAIWSPSAKRRLLGAIADAWREDLRGDGTPEATIERRIARSDGVLGAAPVLIVPWVRFRGAHPYPDAERSDAEREMFLLSGGAAIQNLLLALSAQGLASCWISSTLFCQEESRAALGMSDEWWALGTVAVGPMPAGAASPRPPLDLSEHLRTE